VYTHPQHKRGSRAAQLRKEGGAWLRQLRELRGLSQRQMAGALDIEYYTFISQIEAGRGRVPPERYEDWARVLGVSPGHFVKQLISYYDPITYRLLFEEGGLCQTRVEEPL